MAGDAGTTSDGHHTFDELYHHRTMLFLYLSTIYDRFRIQPAWKAKAHADGSMFDGYFLAGITTPTGDATYHVRMAYWDIWPGVARELGPEFDGHTPDDTLTRIGNLLFRHGIDIPKY